MRPCRRLLALLPLLLASCRAAPVRVPLADLVPPGTASFALDPVPVPAEAELSDLLAPLGRVAVTGERPDEPAAPALARLLPDRVPPGRADAIVALGDAAGPPESFSIDVRIDGDRVRIDLRGADPAGRAFAAATLRQIVLAKGGRRFVRLGRIRDRPGFPLRGSKRPRGFEADYRENFAWQGGAGAGLERVATLAPGGTLDATESGVARATAFFAEGLRRGVRRFALRFDDVTYHLTEESRELYGTYPRAIVAYLTACRERLRRLSPDAVLYWLPQTYWTHHPLFSRFARDVGTAGGLPEDLGLVLTGPEVISAEISAAEVAAARAAFGLTRTKALIYDNRGRKGDHGPLRGRDPELPAQADAVFGERGEVLNRITRLDYAWNPAAYAPLRSHLLACRELVGAAAAPALSRLVLEGPSLPALARLALYREVWRRLDPPPGSPLSPEAVLPAIWRDSAKRIDIDTESQSP